MNEGFSLRLPWKHFYLCVAVTVIAFALAAPGGCQTASTGAVTGITSDSSGALVPDVDITLTKENSGETRSATSDDEGRFGVLLLSPGAYDLKAKKSNFEPLTLSDLHVSVTETLRVDVRLFVARRVEHVEVSATSSLVQADSSVLGRVLDQTAVTNLPLVTRNFAQITGLSPGVNVGVYNAGELGNGGMALSQLGKSTDGIYVHGARSYDNNWQLDGISVSDVQGSGAISGGIPIPNPDSLDEFKVQTGLYNAAFGRAAGANVSVITQSGSNGYHGTIFEFLRNDVLNANDFFLN